MVVNDKMGRREFCGHVHAPNNDSRIQPTSVSKKCYEVSVNTYAASIELEKTDYFNQRI